SLTYLQEFFGRDSTSFTIRAGQRTQFEAPQTGLKTQTDLFADLDNRLRNAVIPPEALHALANAAGLNLNAQSPQKQIGVYLGQIRAFQPLIQLAANAPVT